ncbi:hypothetical protein K491DRAFT_714375 [Lophiostoma macrostomum CBS 122681]|uniref:Extracellular membrane protein CFEM domain-containing protein n=1 Tax=Lophiostoma macrostomum CBS 122681 TaxID=1314788 RepID=A0A6A6TEW1_9PLEO|nr:hypothetical protein K491DRAFT_714375 [Lophiostoma macrostomum CBS 122681]
MKLAVLIASCLSLAAATPVSLPATDETQACLCPEVFCAWSLGGECECENLAADKCYKQQLAQGMLDCPKPVKKNCNDLHWARELRLCGRPHDKACPEHQHCAYTNCRKDDHLCTGTCQPDDDFLTIESE